MALTNQPETEMAIKGKKKVIMVEAEESQDRNDKARCMGFLLSIIKIFMNGALLSIDQEKLLQLVMHSTTNPMQKTSKKESESEPVVVSDNSSTGSNMTANFGQTSAEEP